MVNDKHINNKEQWIDQVLASTQGMQRATPPDGLYENVMQQLNNPAKPTVMPVPAIKWAAAAAVLLVLNVGSVMYASSGSYTSKQNKASTINPIATEIQSESTYNY